MVKNFYRLNASRVTFREYAFDNPWFLVIPIAGAIKLFGIRIAGSSDDPPVESLAPFEVPEAEMPEDVRQRFAPLTAELNALGFGPPIFHRIDCARQHTCIYWATLTHSSGKAAARIHHRIWTQGNIHKSYLFPVFVSEMSDGAYVVSSAGKPDFISPKSVEVRYRKGSNAAELWKEHERRLDEHLPAHPVDTRNEQQLRQMIERLHATLRDFHVGRGVFVPVTAAEREKLAERNESQPTNAPVVSLEDAVLARLEKMGSQRISWVNFLLVLAISLGAFLAAGLKGTDRGFLWLLVPILLFHELGHYVAMRCFGYRNLRMFFIPFFGAAVAGKNFNIAGWKKALVALAGPVPGIFVGAALGMFGLLLSQPKVTEAATLMMIVNGLNLLPFLPLDGGWVMHAVLFCRHPLLDMTFRVVAVIAFFVFAALIGGQIYFLGIVLLIGLPAAWHTAKVAERLRRRAVIATSPDDVSIPEPAARTILAELGAGRHSRTPANILAQQVSNIFETLNARPPGVLASFALIATQCSAFLVAVVFSIAFVVFRNGLPFQGGPASFERPMLYSYQAGHADLLTDVKTSFLGDAVPVPDPPGKPALPIVTLLGSYADEATASEKLAEMLRADRLGGRGKGQVVCRFGQTVLVVLPKNDDDGRSRWKESLDRSASAVLAAEEHEMLFFRLSCSLADEQKAQDLVEELNAYFNCGVTEWLLPPWSPTYAALPSEQRKSIEKARRTFGRLAMIDNRAAEDPEVQAMFKDRMQFLQSHDLNTRRQFFERQNQAMQAARNRAVAEMVADKDRTDSLVVEHWQYLTKLRKEMHDLVRDSDRVASRRKLLTGNEKLEEINHRMAICAGPLTLAVLPETKSNLYSCGGAVLREGSTLTFGSLQFRCPAVALPVFAEWLASRGATDFHYGYDGMLDDLGVGEDEDH